ncbi:hypothetical protein [Clostridium sp. C8-1-8]|uniref:hypothetical protein n=1 Tax=Clostridium sp. C8-1-8 TaxID=2698831 RepID=UPI00136C4593|nr:hypothetical protein [Clostridium sp. C8-1-8]
MKNISLIFILLCSMLLLFGCSNSKNNLDKIIDNPDKIILYKDGNQKEILPSDTNFKKIIDLTNERIDADTLSVAKDGIKIDEVVTDNKKKYLGIEFIYDKEQEMDINNSNGFSPIKYNRLYFNLSDNNSTYFQYGNKENYVDSSRGPLKSSNKLLDIIK